MIAQIGIGTLGLSGKYQNLSPDNAKKIIKSIEGANFEIIDSATVYAEGGNSIDNLFSENEVFKDKSVYFKIGADNLTGNVDSLINEFNVAYAHYGKMLKCVMLHRTDEKLAKIHKVFFQFMRENHANILLGISTHSDSVLDFYSELNIDLVQAPLNLIDYLGNINIFLKAKRFGLITQARSCLASGLLSGRYAKEDLNNFHDSIRGRYKEDLDKIRTYNKRIESVDRVMDFYKIVCKKYNLNISMSNFAYSIIANLECVDHIIVGGTTLEQVYDNISLKEMPVDLMSDILKEYVYDWQGTAL